MGKSGPQAIISNPSSSKNSAPCDTAQYAVRKIVHIAPCVRWGFNTLLTRTTVLPSRTMLSFARASLLVLGFTSLCWSRTRREIVLVDRDPPLTKDLRIAKTSLKEVSPLLIHVASAGIFCVHASTLPWQLSTNSKVGLLRSNGQVS